MSQEKASLATYIVICPLDDVCLDPEYTMIAIQLTLSLKKAGCSFIKPKKKFACHSCHNKKIKCTHFGSVAIAKRRKPQFVARTAHTSIASPAMETLKRKEPLQRPTSSPMCKKRRSDSATAATPFEVIDLCTSDEEKDERETSTSPLLGSAKPSEPSELSESQAAAPAAPETTHTVKDATPATQTMPEETATKEVLGDADAVTATFDPQAVAPAAGETTQTVKDTTPAAETMPEVTAGNEVLGDVVAVTFAPQAAAPATEDQAEQGEGSGIPAPQAATSTAEKAVPATYPRFFVSTLAFQADVPAATTENATPAEATPEEADADKALPVETASTPAIQAAAPAAEDAAPAETLQSLVDIMKSLDDSVIDNFVWDDDPALYPTPTLSLLQELPWHNETSVESTPSASHPLPPKETTVKRNEPSNESTPSASHPLPLKEATVKRKQPSNESTPSASHPLPPSATAWSPWSSSVEDEPLTVATVKRKEPSNESTCSCDGCATKEGKYCYLNCHLSS